MTAPVGVVLRLRRGAVEDGDVEQFEYNGLPAEPVRLAVCDWLEFHTIDPSRVLVPGWIERRCAARQVAYWAVDVDEDGDWQRDPVDPERFRCCVEVVQLEARPLSFPSVVVAP